MVDLDRMCRFLHRRGMPLAMFLCRRAGGLNSSRDGLQEASAVRVAGGYLHPDDPVRCRCGAVYGAVVAVEERGYLEGELSAGATVCGYAIGLLLLLLLLVLLQGL